MELHFTNGYSRPLSIAIMFYSPDGCGAYGSWGTRGWWSLDPGGSAYVLNTNNRYAAYYAEATDGRIWAGDRGPVYVYPSAFDSCLKIGSTAARQVNMRSVDLQQFSTYRLT